MTAAVDNKNTVRLRALKETDAPLMLEWMHDPDVVRNMRANFASKTLEDCKAFIRAAAAGAEQASEGRLPEDLHLAIVSEEDEYMGTVSLKHIKAKTAEFGITVRRCAMGKGYSIAGMRQIAMTGFKELGLESIYWCVDPANRRAVRFYDKNGFARCCAPAEATAYTEEEKTGFIWYSIEMRDIQDPAENDHM